MIQNTHDGTQSWKSILAVTVGSLLSVALYALLCWGVNCTDLKYQWHARRMYVGIAWVVMTVFLFMASKITADGDCNHEIRKHLLLGRKAMTDPDSVLKSRNISLPTKIFIVKGMVFQAVMYDYES